jgi:hypothetical protein
MWNQKRDSHRRYGDDRGKENRDVSVEEGEKR